MPDDNLKPPCAAQNQTGDNECPLTDLEAVEVKKCLTVSAALRYTESSSILASGHENIWNPGKRAHCCGCGPGKEAEEQPPGGHKDKDSA